MLGHPRHATRVWDAILPMDLPLDDSLAVDPVNWQKFVLHQGAAPFIGNLYTETCILIKAGLEEAAVVHSVIGLAGTLELWLDLLPQLSATSETHHALLRLWEDFMPNLCGTQLQVT